LYSYYLFNYFFLKKGEWSTGIEWNIIEFLTNIYVAYVLGQSHAKQNNNNHQETVSNSNFKLNLKTICDIPRQVFIFSTFQLYYCSIVN
jgi:hypothetical protein